MVRSGSTHNVIPHTGATLKQTEYDILMMAICAALERTEDQWRTVFDKAGLKVRDLWTYDKELGASLIIGVTSDSTEPSSKRIVVVDTDN